MKRSKARPGAPQDPVRARLRERGVAAHVLEGGLDGLLERWQRIVAEVEGGYRHGLDDWLDDMDARDILDDALAVATGAAGREARVRTLALDARLRAVTVPAGRCLWGARVARERGLVRARQWWYFERPARPGADLAADLGIEQDR